MKYSLYLHPFLVTWLLVCALSGCVSTHPGAVGDGAKSKLPPGSYEVFGEVYQVLPTAAGYQELGVASWYGKKFHGRLTANGETYDMYQVSAAHKSLPLPTRVRVVNLDNGRKIDLRVNDRGPFVDDRLIDLSYAAAKALGYAERGTAPVLVIALDDDAATATDAPQHYLQAGVFGQAQGAKTRLRRIAGLLRGMQIDVAVRVLESESAEAVLHKVWIGPLVDVDQREAIADLLLDNAMGKAIAVTVN